MKKKRVNEILKKQAIRKNNIIKYICVIFAFFAMSLALFILYSAFSQIQYIPYEETSDLKTRVNYKENEFFTDTNATSEEYIANLIDSINSEFSYHLNITDKDAEYAYLYQIIAEVKVIDKNSKNTIYTYEDQLLPKTTEQKNKDELDILENVTINYQKYNNIVKKFVNAYDLDNVSAYLEVRMDVFVNGNCEKTNNLNTNTVVKMNIPLNEKTVAIDIVNDLKSSNKEKFLKCENTNNYRYVYLIGAIFLLIISIIYTYQLYKYIIKTRTPEDIYEKELNKILNNYKSYIQKINNTIDLRRYNVMKVDTFTDLLEIKEAVGTPILMLENKEKNGTTFLIPSHDKLMYTYSIKVKEIKQKQTSGDKSNEL